MAAQIMRLAGTLNVQRNSVCDILIDTNKTISFEELCQGTLVTATDSLGLKRLGYSATPQELDENRNLAQARGIRLQRPIQNVNVPGEFSSKTVTDADRRLWTYRLLFLEAIVRHRGGIEEGYRNHFFWRISLCLAWVSTSNDEFKARLLESFNTHFATNWSWAEALSTCSAVITRRATGNLYRLVNADVFPASLCISEEEQQLFSHLLHCPGKNGKRVTWRTGAMNFQRIPGGLDFSTFEKEVRRRQALAGARSAQTRKSNHTPETIARAHQLTAFGLSRKDIILDLGVSRSTLNRWLGIENSGVKFKRSWKDVGPSKSQTHAMQQTKSMFEFVMQFEYANRELFSRGMPISHGADYLAWMAAKEAHVKSTLN